MKRNNRTKLIILLCLGFPIISIAFQNCSKVQSFDMIKSDQASLAVPETQQEQEPAAQPQPVAQPEPQPTVVMPLGQEAVVPITCSNISDTQGDMVVKFTHAGSNNYDLSFGTLADNYWDNGQYDKQMSFSIDDLSQIESFILNQAAFDDWLWVKVNGVTVYIGPESDKGIESIELSDGKVMTNAGTFDGELSTSWNKELNIDLKPFLQAGKNIIWTRTIVQGLGENYINMRIKRTCMN